LSEIRATTISDAAGTGPISLTGQSAAKAWVRVFYSSGVPSSIGSFNVSSIADNGTGTYTSSFSSSFDNDDYAIGSQSTNDRVGLVTCELESHIQTTSCRITINDSRTASFNDWNSSVAFHGDLA
jgi:hypothetical protein